MPSILELREQQEELVTAARAKYDEITEDTSETRAGEIEAEYDSLMADYDRLDKRIERMKALEDAEKRLNDTGATSPGKPNGDGGGAEERTFDEVFESYMRNGASNLERRDRDILVEHRAQSVGTDSAGGYTVPEGFFADLVKSLKMWGPMYDPGVTRMVPTSTGNDLPWPTMNDTSNKGALLAENTADTEQDITFGNKTLNAYKYTSKIIRVSEELLQDSALDVQGIIRDAMAERLGRIGNEHLTTGTGSSQPNGIVTASTLGVTAASATAITLDELIDLQHSVDPAYRMNPNVRFMFNDSTLKALRKIKDSDGLYIWQTPNARTDEPATLLGNSYSVNQDMAAIATGNKTVLYGDFSRYVVRLVRDFSVKRLIERYAEFYQVGFLGFARFDGELMDTAAVKHLIQA